MRASANELNKCTVLSRSLSSYFSRLHDHVRLVDLLLFHRLPEVAIGDPARALRVHFAERRRPGQLLQLEDSVEELQDNLDVRRRLGQRVDHLLANGPVHDVTLEHGQHHCHHLLEQVEKLEQQVELRDVLRQFVLHMREQEEETAHCVPETRVCQRLLVAAAGTLDEFGQRVEYLLRGRYSLAEVLFTLVSNRQTERRSSGKQKQYIRRIRSTLVNVRLKFAMHMCEQCTLTRAGLIETRIFLNLLKNSTRIYAAAELYASLRGH